ncbi:MAG: glycosyltransferase family 1 protein [bacterium]|nr:glycosyltransferase family 1 protein [bacterium]
MIKIGIECENLEDPKSRWGVGQVTLNLLEEYAKNLEWQKKYKLYLYFKSGIPNDEVLKNPIFIKRLSRARSFNFFYHILMPIRAIMDGLDWMFFPAYMLPPLYLGKSIVMLTDDVYYEYKYGSLPFRYKLAYRLFTNWAAIKAKKILAISETSKKEVAMLYNINSQKIFVSYLGVNQSRLLIDDSQLSNYILYVGQMFPRRHAKETILAFKKIASEFSDSKLVMVGEDKYHPPIINELVQRTNQGLGSQRIVYYNYLDKKEDLNRLYDGAKALIYVSDREAFGLPPMEALSFGIPPVITDNELGHELFGDYAFYSKSGSIEDIAKAMKEALSNEQKANKIRFEGPEFVKKYNWKSFAERFFENVKR